MQAGEIFVLCQYSISGFGVFTIIKPVENKTQTQYFKMSLWFE